MMKFLVCLAASAAILAAEPWNMFRGPNGTGVADSRDLPVDLESSLIWKTAIPPGHSSPVAGDRHLFVTAYEGDKLFTIALDRDTGAIAWKTEAARKQVTKIRARNSPASPSPATDGLNVYVYFEDAGMFAYGPGGKLLWHSDLGAFRTPYGPASSPIVLGDRIILLLDQDTNSHLIAIGKPDGKVRWKTARLEATHGFATPVVYKPKSGGEQIIVSGSYQLIGYDAKTGAKAWWVDGMAWQAKSTPTISGDVAYVHSWMASPAELGLPSMLPEWKAALETSDTNKDGRISLDEMAEPSLKPVWFLFDLDGDSVMNEREWNTYRDRGTAKNGLYAIRLGAGKGDLTRDAVLWRFDKSLPNIPSPVLYQGSLFVLKEGGVLTSLDPKTGQPLKQGRLEGALDPYFASPVAADGKLYTVSMNGKVRVVKADAEWSVIGSHDLKQEVWATPAIAGDRIYIRTVEGLYCFGKKKGVV